MLDIKKLRDDFEAVCKKVRTRCKKYEQLDGFMQKYPDTSLVIIDTLQQVREVGGEN